MEEELGLYDFGGARYTEHLIDNLCNMSIILLISFIVAVVINILLLWKKDRKKTLIIILIIFVVEIVSVITSYNISDDINSYIAFSLLLTFLLSITFEDVMTKFMDIRVIIGFFVLFLIYRIIFLDITIFLEGFIGFILSLVIMLIAYFAKKDSIGIGDVEVIATCGMILGYPSIFQFLFKTFLWVFIVGLFLIISKKKKLLSELPLAPFLLLATII